MKKKVIEIVSQLLLFSILSLGSLNIICKMYFPLGADNQALLLWKYSAGLGILPYKEIFYPYGLLFYYLDQNIFFVLFYFLLAPFVLLTVFLGLKYLFQDKLFAISSFIIFYIFIVTITGFETFNRYGMVTAAAIIFAFVFYHNKNKLKRVLIASGILTGLFFPFINDFGLYVPILFITFALINTWIKSRFNKKSIIFFFQNTGLFLFGYLIGLVPFIVYLVLTESFSWFVFYLQNLRDIAQFAKTPFFHTITSRDNIFTLGMLVVTIFILCSKFFWTKTKITFNNYLQIGLVTVLVLFEQKSIIRVIDTQISFLGLLLYFSLFYELLHYGKKYKFSNRILFLYFINSSIAILFLLGLHPATATNPFVNIKNVFTVNNFTNKSCVDKNMRAITSTNVEIMEVKEYVEKIPEFNGKVFTFPGEPIFYILFNQRPPYYPTIYEATPKYSQEMLIRYIEDENIDIILYNAKIKSIHDEVPDRVRGRYLYQYLQTHFSILERVNDYIILKRNAKVQS
jgi:hypothetical protein